MSVRCDQCRARVTVGNRTATRVLCDRCYAEFMGLAAGYLASGGNPIQSIATAVVNRSLHDNHNE
jgi:hypothetical protein